jgi:ribosomal protein L31
MSNSTIKADEIEMDVKHATHLVYIIINVHTCNII